ncbi:hypothetical protein [Nitrosococcus oceani]|uniref:hypothetical protein n=1 Tax=Nitrosococcus oceani TaxID=1229 RepID=UPI0004E950C4|nr:hypothetical protein [Nitrosococcus oceani]KFI22369.1 hypothetical protein HW44_09895 [Nitrosococcus oceani]
MQSGIRYALIFLYVIAILPAIGLAEQMCGELLPEEAYRYRGQQDDYLDPDPRAKHHLELAEAHHFSTKVRMFDSFPMFIMQNLDYLLRHFPNHHKGLYTVSQFEDHVGGKLPQKRGWSWRRSAACYFDRAIRFRPNDGVVRMLYGIYLHKENNLKKALEQYKIGLDLIPDSSELNYNLGLLYYDLKKYKLARKYAATAYELGYPLPGLRDMLKKIGYWP